MRTWAKITIPILILALGILGARILIKTRPETSRKTPKERATLVDTRPLKAAPITLRIPAQGTVIPAQQIALKPQVNGRITQISPALIPGGRFRQDEILARLDDRDLKMTLADRESQLARARLDLAMEKGRQDVAKREWALINTELPAEAHGPQNQLALRIPHIASANAAVNAAAAAVERARRDVERTIIRAPFNAIVKDEALDIGQTVNTQTAAATLVGTDRFLVQISIPIQALAAIRLPDSEGRQGSPVEVFASNSNQPRKGQLIRVLGDLDPVGRMARVLVAIDDPLNLNKPAEDTQPPPLFLGDYVRVEILGQSFPRAYEIPRLALRSGKEIWIYRNHRLEIRPIDAAWRGLETVVITRGLDDGELLITSPIPTPILGMKLRRADQDSEPQTPEKGPQEKRS